MTSQTNAGGERSQDGGPGPGEPAAAKAPVAKPQSGGQKPKGQGGKRPSVEPPAAQAPAATAPAGKPPAAKAPANSTPAGKASAAKASTVNAPANSTPAGRAPAGKAPAVKAAGRPAAAKAQAATAPSGQQRAAQASAPTGKAAKTPAAKTPAAKAPADTTPAAKASVDKAPAAKSQAAKASTTKPPAGRASGAKAPVSRPPAATPPTAPAPERSRRGSLARWIAASVGVLLLIVAVVVAGVWFSTPHYRVAGVLEPAAPQALVAPVGGQQQGGQPAGPAPSGDALRAAAQDPALGELSAEVTDLATGTVIFSSQPDRPLPPASATKVLTYAASTLALPAGHRLHTRVLDAGDGKLVIRGEGDVTLERKQGSGFFTDAASVSDLAAQVRASLGDAAASKVKSIVVDNSVRSGDVFASTWDRADVAGGNVANLDSVMLDAGRLNPADEYSPRSSEPGTDVARALAAELGAPGASVSTAPSVDLPGGATVLAQVASAPLEQRQRDMMLHSDNLLAEAIGREIAAQRNQPTTFAGATAATLDVLSSNGVDVSGVVLRDNSGMSKENRASAHALNSLMARPELRDIAGVLPVAHADGTLRTRYGDGSGSADAAGFVRAKTGTLTGVNALVGTVITQSGRPMSFAFLTSGSQPDAARPALDRLAAAIYRL